MLVFPHTTAAAVLCRDSLAPADSPCLLGGVARMVSEDGSLAMQTDSEKRLNAGVALAERRWVAFCAELGWTAATPQRIIAHQEGKRHTQLLFEHLALDPAKDWRTSERLGNVAPSPCPPLALAHEANAIGDSSGDAILPGNSVVLLGIGSGLRSRMLGLGFLGTPPPPGAPERKHGQKDTAI